MGLRRKLLLAPRDGDHFPFRRKKGLGEGRVRRLITISFHLCPSRELHSTLTILLCGGAISNLQILHVPLTRLEFVGLLLNESHYRTSCNTDTHPCHSYFNLCAYVGWVWV